MNTRRYRLNRIAVELENESRVAQVQVAAAERKHALTTRTAPGIAPIAPEALAGLFNSDPTAAWAALAAMTELQRVNMAIEYAVWLESEGREVRWGAILDCWERKLAAKFAAQAAPPTPEQVAGACRALATEYRETAAALEAQGNTEAAKDLRSAARAADKAAFYALGGEQVYRWIGDDLLVQSASDRRVYAVGTIACPCEAGEHGRNCWHMQLRCGYIRAEEGVCAHVCAQTA
jgi:hypothetical protein